LPNLKEFLQMFVTFAMVTIGWIFFRSESISDAVNFLAKIPTKSLLSLPFMPSKMTTFGFIIIMLAIEWLQRDKMHGLETFGLSWKPIFRYAFYYTLIMFILLFSIFNQQTTFIYFQF